jgi:hypothetical protein
VAFSTRCRDSRCPRRGLRPLGYRISQQVRVLDRSKPLQHIDQRLNLTTATNPNARWLFPGRRGGEPMTPDTLEKRLRQHQIPGLRGRTAAIRQLVLQAPAPVVAKMLGYNPDHTAHLVAEAGGTWTRYAAGDHTHR